MCGPRAPAPPPPPPPPPAPVVRADTTELADDEGIRTARERIRESRQRANRRKLQIPLGTTVGQRGSGLSL